MWNVWPELICMQHILGEHLELHMFLGAIKKNYKLNGYLKNGLLEINNIKIRHDILKEYIKNEKTPISEEEEKLILETHLKYKCIENKIYISSNIKELYRRCENCRKRIDYILFGVGVSVKLYK